MSSQNVTTNLNIIGAVLMFWRLNLNVPKCVNYFLSNVLPLSISLFYAYIIIVNKEEFVKPMYKSEGVVLHYVDTITASVSTGFVYCSQIFYFIRRNKIKYILQRTNIYCDIHTIKAPYVPGEYISILICLIICTNLFAKSTLYVHLLITVNIIFRATQTYIICYMFRLYTNIYKEINAQVYTACSIETNRKTIEVLLNNIIKRCSEGNECLKQLSELFNPLFVGVFCSCLFGFINDVYHVSFLIMNNIHDEYEEFELIVLQWKTFRIVALLTTIICIIHVCSNLVEEVSILNW